MSVSSPGYGRGPSPGFPLSLFRREVSVLSSTLVEVTVEVVGSFCLFS